VAAQALEELAERARAASSDAPLPLVNSSGQSLSRMCADQMFSAGLSHELSSRKKLRAASFCYMVAMENSSDASLPGMKLSVCMMWCLYPGRAGVSGVGG
jgi:hypothetical protein